MAKKKRGDPGVILAIGTFAMLAVAAAYVIWPLVARTATPSASQRDDSELEMLYGALRDLDLDLKLGKIDDADHRGMRRDLEKEIARCVTRIEAAGEADLAHSLESEIAAARKINK